ncbi:hypothetical protein PR202_gb24937 [Eleusine coracana subsp. coracana]|uniref:Uncharacterized protein n=1 Tax=Eleusine coracana subsp. coracana TaxID=191504 RepID=A0AAV5FM96_ELECO|nr:hypothetical protein PR202_gb24937 [Eleusine coracana subsp. coracana]
MEENGPQEPLLCPHLGVDHESLQQPSGSRKEGGWITFPYLGVAIMGLGLATNGVMSNLVVYLIQEYNVPSVDAAQIGNIVNGCLSLGPVIGAVVADAFFGCYPVVVVSMFFSVLVSTRTCHLHLISFDTARKPSLIVFTLTAGLHSLRPTPCKQPAGSAGSPCSPASAGQMAALYTGIFLLCVSAAGSRFNQATMGADQFDSPADRDVLFNWYFILLYSSSVLSSTAITYVQDTVSWTLGFGIAAAASVVGLAGLLLGSPYYRRPAVRCSPFTGLARVVVAAARKRNVNVTTLSSAYIIINCRFLNRAALIMDEDIITTEKGSVARSWRICTVQQVEDFKTVLRILPLWSASIFLSVAISAQINFTILQAMSMDRAIHRFTVPAASINVSCLLATVIFIGLLDRAILPLLRRLTGHTPTPLQLIGAGHVITVVSMAASAAIDRQRIATVHAAGQQGNPAWVSPMSAMWLVLPFALTGAGEALHFPGQISLYYQEFPPSLKNTSTGMVAMIIALGFYLGTAFIGVVRHTTSWLPDNMNASRLENLYWLVTVLLAINFGYYLTCARFYKYQNTPRFVDSCY